MDYYYYYYEHIYLIIYHNIIVIYLFIPTMIEIGVETILIQKSLVNLLNMEL